MKMGELPDNFDVVVVGTGMPESIIAAAAARIGKTVLHLDRNAYYGGEWTSFSYDKFMEWVDSIVNMEPSIGTPIDLVSTLASSLRDGENIVTCPLRSRTISNLSFKAFVRDVPEAKEPESVNDVIDNSEIAVENSENCPDTSIESEESSNQADTNEQSDQETINAESNNESGDSIPSSPNAIQSREIDLELTLSYFMENRRRFNIDLAPKLLFARGSLVELLISSNIARYAEFQCINRVLTHINGHIEQVPCSRADVFSTKNVGIVEKRMLMKFLTFSLKYQEHEDEYRGYEDKPFVEFLRSKKLTPNVEHYIIHAIAMVGESCSTLQGLISTQKFLESLGRYGKSPFLCTCYGSAELPQCFCRLCAVFAGTYYLQRKVEGVVFSDEDNKCKAVITSGQRISCQCLVMESSYAPTEFYACNTPPQRISRAVLITDASVYPSEKKESTLLRLPPGPGIEHTITVLELSSKNYVCPDDVYLVYMSCRSSNPTAEEDLKAAVNLLFHSSESDSIDDKSTSKPNLLWSVYFNQRDTSTVDLNARTPLGVYLTSSPDIELDYEHAVNEAKMVFEKMFPGEEFLPRAPDPEDIVIENQNNPGEEGGKIENDVTDTDDTTGNEDESTAESDSSSQMAEKSNESEE